MSYASKILIVLVILSFIGGVIALIAWDMSPEYSQVEEIVYPKNQMSRCLSLDNNLFI